jgi:hypothetical protein
MPLRDFSQHYLLGFDIIAFNDRIGAGDACLSDFLEEKFGKDARELIEKLIQAH